jgi:hypothetical protein
MNQQKLLKGLVMMLLLLQVLSETYEILLNQQKVLTDFLLIIQTKCLKKLSVKVKSSQRIQKIMGST